MKKIKEEIFLLLASFFFVYAPGEVDRGGVDSSDYLNQQQNNQSDDERKQQLEMQKKLSHVSDRDVSDIQDIEKSSDISVIHTDAQANYNEAKMFERETIEAGEIGDSDIIFNVGKNQQNNLVLSSARTIMQKRGNIFYSYFRKKYRRSVKKWHMQDDNAQYRISSFLLRTLTDSANFIEGNFSKGLKRVFDGILEKLYRLRFFPKNQKVFLKFIVDTLRFRGENTTDLQVLQIIVTERLAILPIIQEMNQAIENHDYNTAIGAAQALDKKLQEIAQDQGVYFFENDIDDVFQE